MENLEQLISYPIATYRENPLLFQQVSDIHRTLFRTSICCLPELESALTRLNNYLQNQNQKPMDSQRYVLKPDSLLYSTENQMYYTDKTITDDDAMEMLKVSPSLIEQFAQYPADWETEVANFKRSVPTTSGDNGDEPTTEKKKSKK